MSDKITASNKLKIMIALALAVNVATFFSQVGLPKIRSDPSALDSLEAEFDSQCHKPIHSSRSDNVFITRLLSVNGSQHEDDLSFKSFIERFIPGTLIQNMCSFPIFKIEQIWDPKTNSMPKVLVPHYLSRQSATSVDEIKIETLPELKTDEKGVRRITNAIEQNAIIYLPNPYVVAGSFHRETYPNDTSAVLWAMLELLNKKKLSNPDEFSKIIKDQLENFLFQTETFGFPLNGNRGYYVTRSQTNIFPKNVLQYYLFKKDKNWLEKKGLPLAEGVFNYWTGSYATVSTPHGDGYTWIAHGKGPCLEVMKSHEAHGFYYFKVLKLLLEYLKTPDEKRPDFAKGFDYKRVVEKVPSKNVQRYFSEGLLAKQTVPELGNDYQAFLLDKQVNNYDTSEPVIKAGNNFYKLTGEYYQSDRASRTSGYDTNHLYGPFNSFTSDFIPVDHNILLYSHAKDIAEIYSILGNIQKQAEYNEKAKNLKEMIMKTLWDEGCKMFFEFNSRSKSLRTNYPFLSSGYALFAELFDIENKNEREKLLNVIKYLEDYLEGPSGFYASAIESGLHWDMPYVWPVQQQYIVGGLREYASKFKELGDEGASNYLTNIADRISVKYLLSNYADWLNSNGTKIGEKVIPKVEELLTGYEAGSNYTWNLTAVNYLYSTLSSDAKKAFDSIID